MKNLFPSLIVISLISLLACTQPGATRSLQKPTGLQLAIIGGEEVASGTREIFSTVGVYDRKTQSLCTGTLLSDQLVLTAAHCIGEDPQQMQIMFKNQLPSVGPEEIRSVLAARKHPQFNPNVNEKDLSDLALIRMHPGAGLPVGFGPARILSEFSLLKAGTSVLAVGYGLHWAWGVQSGSGILRQVELEIENPDFAKTEIEVDQSILGGICSGDSGGPGYIDVDGELYLWGVVSRSDSSSSLIFPSCYLFAIYTRVDAFEAWIEITSLELLSLSAI